MNINQGPYQRLIDIIDVILTKNEATVKSEIFLHPSEIPSLPQNSHGVIMLCDFLNTLEKKGVILRIDNSADIKKLIENATNSANPFDFAIYKITKLDKAAEQKLLAEKQSILEKAQAVISSSGEKISLSDNKLSFDDNQAIISIGKRQCALPPYKNEHYFCRAMFAYKPNEPVDWSLIYKLMTGGQEEVADAKYRRTVQDTMYALNKRVKEIINTDDALFTWENRTIKRNY